MSLREDPTVTKEKKERATPLKRHAMLVRATFGAMSTSAIVSGISEAEPFIVGGGIIGLAVYTGMVIDAWRDGESKDEPASEDIPSEIEQKWNRVISDIVNWEHYESQVASFLGPDPWKVVTDDKEWSFVLNATTNDTLVEPPKPVDNTVARPAHGPNHDPSNPFTTVYSNCLRCYGRNNTEAPMCEDCIGIHATCSQCLSDINVSRSTGICDKCRVINETNRASGRFAACALCEREGMTLTTSGICSSCRDKSLAEVERVERELGVERWRPREPDLPDRVRVKRDMVLYARDGRRVIYRVGNIMETVHYDPGEIKKLIRQGRVQAV